MSLILDALNKADRDREQQAPITAPAPVPQYAAPMALYASSEPPRHWSAYVMLALLAVIVVLLVALLLKPTVPAPVAAPPPAPAAAPVAPAVSVAAPAPVATAQTTAAASEVQDIYQDTAQDGPSVDAVEGLYSETPAAPSRKISPSKRRLLDELDAEAAALDAQGTYEEEAPTEDIRPRASPKAPRATDTPSPSAQANGLDPEEVKRLWEQTKKDIPDTSANPNALQTHIQNALKNTLASYKDVPYLNELPARFQSSLPSINYENHVYTEKGGAVTLNKSTFKAGDTISNGLVLKRIASDGVILEFNGKTFKLAALNSWVNL